MISIDTTANHSGDDKLPPRTIWFSQNEEMRMRYESTTELWMQLSSTTVFKRKKEMLPVPLDFGTGLSKDALVDSKVYVSAIAHIELDRIKQQASATIFKIDDPTIF